LITPSLAQERQLKEWSIGEGATVVIPDHLGQYKTNWVMAPGMRVLCTAFRDMGKG